MAPVLSPEPRPRPDVPSVSPALRANAAAGRPVRGERALAILDGWWTRADTLLQRALPPGLQPLAQLGPSANAMLLLATASGVLLLCWYSPSVQTAWSSLAQLPPRSLGGVVRSVHRYSSDLAMLLVLAHALRTLAGRKFAAARWLAWVSGAGMLGLVWFVGWTGYWLVWDQRAQLVAIDTMTVLDVLPLFGEPLGRLYASDRSVPSLLFFVVFFLHLLLPLGVAAGLALHVARLTRARLWPDRRLAAALFGAVLAAAVLLPVSSAPPARMHEKPAAFTMDWWYLAPLAVTRRLSGGGVWLAALLAGGAWLAVPWWLGRRRPAPSYQATVNVSRCFGCTLCSRDCPFAAITMVPRTDGKPFPSQAWVDPARCLGCGVCVGACDTQAINLPGMDAREFAASREAELATATGSPVAFAFVCAQVDGGWGSFDHVAWARRLPGYRVHPVPCSGWIEARLLERLVARGVRAILVVGCASAEPPAREGDRWLRARLAGVREPEFRPARADPCRVAHASFDPLRPALVSAAAARLLAGTPPLRAARGLPVWTAGLLVAAVALAVVVPASRAPFRNPAAEQPEFVFTFRARGAWIDGRVTAPPDGDTRPVHMRAAQPVRRTRQPVLVRLTVDGRLEERLFRPKGWQRDGASAGEWTIALPPGAHQVAVAVSAGGSGGSGAEWSGVIVAEPHRRHVLSFEPGSGFVLDP